MLEKLSQSASDKSFATGFSIFWFGLSLIHYCPTEIPFADYAPSLTAIIILISLAVGSICAPVSDLRIRSASWNPSEPDQTESSPSIDPVKLSELYRSAWYGAFAMVCLLLLSSGYDLAVIPLVKVDRPSLTLASGVALAMLLAMAFTFFRLGQTLGIYVVVQDFKKLLKNLAIGCIVGCAIFSATLLVLTGPGSLIFGLIFLPVKPRVPVLITAIVVAYFCQNSTTKFIFSPYQKLAVEEVKPEIFMISSNGLLFNSCAHMLDPEQLPYFAKLTNPEVKTFQQYLGRLALPIGLSRHSMDDVLILGANSGNDVSFALKYGAKHIDAVELDSEIIKIARVHPDKPFEHPNVTTLIEDPRQFLKNTKSSYDLIEFCCTNSVRSDNTAYAIKPDSFILTKECIDLALARLKPEGVVFIGFSAPPGSSAPARLYASIVATQDGPYIAYVQQESDTGPLAVRYYFFVVGPGLTQVQKSDLDPFVTQFIHLKPFEAIDEAKTDDDRPFLRAELQDPRVWYSAIAMAIFSLAFLCWVPKPDGSPSFKSPGTASIVPFALGVNPSLCNYLSLIGLTQLVGFHWLTPVAILIFDGVCFLLSSLPKDLKSQQILYWCSLAACATMVLNPDQPIFVCAAAHLQILLTAFILRFTFKRESQLVFFSSTVLGMAAGCICAITAVCFGLRSVSVFCLILMFLSYLGHAKNRKLIATETASIGEDSK